MKKASLFIIVVLAVVMTSCVKEDRDHCPCYLNFAHDGFDNNEYLDDINLHVVHPMVGASDNVYRVEEMIQDISYVGVTRGEIDVYGTVGKSGMKYSGDELVIPYGMQCDPILAFYDHVMATGERALVYGTINKQFARVRIMLNMPEVNGLLAIKVTGNSCGMNMKTFEAIRGNFACLAESWENGIHSFRVPRQTDSSLMLEIWQMPESGSCDINMEGGRRLSFLEIGKIINERLEYDWNTPSLADIDIDIDYVESMVTIRVKEWNLVEMYQISI